MNFSYKKELELYRKQAIKAAEELHYDYDIIVEIGEAKSDVEIEQIMRRARKGGE